MGPVIQVLVIYSKETFKLEYQEIGKRNTVYNSLQMGTTQILIFRRMEKYTGVPAHNRVLSMSE